jgi:hypothetical protein
LRARLILLRFPSSTPGETLPDWQRPRRSTTERITVTEKARLVTSRLVLVVTP